VINGLAAVPIMIVMMLMARSRRVMGQFAVKGVLAWGGWLATLAMTVAALGVFVPGRTTRVPRGRFRHGPSRIKDSRFPTVIAGARRQATSAPSLNPGSRRPA
jgi:hypothetical protein